MKNPSYPPPDTAAVRATLLAAAEAAASLTLGGFRARLAVDNKLASGFDPVTAADRDAESAIRAVIAAAFADHGIFGEELENTPADSPYVWIVDPIDGTRAYISGVPVWGTLVGLTFEGRAIAGLMSQPFTDELWLGVEGRTVYRRGGTESPLRTSTVTRLAAARTTTTAPELFAGAEYGGWTAVRDKVLQVRYGLDCYGYCLLAAGHIDLVVEAGLKDVDVAPLVPIIEGAGGVITSWSGERAEAGGTCVAAATPELHAEAIAVLRQAMLD